MRAALALAWVSADGSRRPLELLKDHDPLSIWRAREDTLAEWAARDDLDGRTDWIGSFCRRRRHFDAREAVGRLRGAGAHFVAWGTESYPPGLSQLKQPPAGLFVRGDLDLWEAILTMARVAIVGTRRPTPYALAVSRALSEGFAAAGVVTVSGMAYGVDEKVHEGTLVARGLTVAILGCGADLVYPRRHADLRDRIAASGAVISELPPGTRAAKWTFPQRNRLLAALGDALVVVQAGERSGALSTAGHALELGREVFVVPGSMLGDAHLGGHRLLRDGATVCVSVDETVQDFFDLTRILRHGRGPARRTLGGATPPPLMPEEALVFMALAGGVRSIDDVAASTGLGVSEAAGVLTLLEMSGRVVRKGPGQFGLGP